MIIPALIGAGSVLAVATIFAAGFVLGHRRGKVASRTDMVRQLLRIHTPEAWSAAHQVEAMNVSEADTVRTKARRRPGSAAPLEE